MALLSTARAVDSKGRYLPWEEFKHRYHPAKIHWAVTKILRKTIAIPLPLLAANGQSFTYALPESFQGYFHTIDKLAKPIFANNSDDKSLALAQSLVEEAISSSQLEGASTTRKVAKEIVGLRFLTFKSVKAISTMPSKMFVATKPFYQEHVLTNIPTLST